MTCIVALKTEDGIYMGADKLGSNGFTGASYKRPKVFVKGEFIFGGSGSYKLLQILEFDFTPPARNINQKEDNYIYTTFFKELKKCLKDNGGLAEEKGIAHMLGDFIFGYNNNIYIFQADMSILEPCVDYATIGSGEYHSSGALEVLANSDLPPQEKIIKAISAAAYHVTSVGNLIDICFLGVNK